MSLFNALQLLLAALAIAVITLRLRRVAFEATLDGAGFAAGLEPALEHRQLELADRIARGLLPAWPARLASEALDALREGVEREVVRSRVDELRFELERASAEHVVTIQTLGRMAGPLAFIGVIIELGRGLSGGEGLLALKRGAVESASLERALLTFALGLGTALVCLSAAALLDRRARELRSDLARVSRAIDRALADRSEM